jgi:hypothetical protein
MYSLGPRCSQSLSPSTSLTSRVHGLHNAKLLSPWQWSGLNSAEHNSRQVARTRKPTCQVKALNCPWGLHQSFRSHSTRSGRCRRKSKAQHHRIQAYDKGTPCLTDFFLVIGYLNSLLVYLVWNQTRIKSVHSPLKTL